MQLNNSRRQCLEAGHILPSMGWFAFTKNKVHCSYSHLVGAAPRCGSICEVQHVLNAIDSEVVTGRTELSTLIVVITMPCTQHTGTQ